MSALGCNKDTACDALRELIEKGFIEAKDRGRVPGQVQTRYRMAAQRPALQCGRCAEPSLSEMART